MITTLDLVKESQKVRVMDISGGWGLRQRLGGLGIHFGDEIVIKKSCFR
jgi:Fe2+ transport system protein FeoA